MEINQEKLGFVFFCYNILPHGNFLFFQETANVTPIKVDDADQICDLLEQAIKNNSQLKYKEKG